MRKSGATQHSRRAAPATLDGPHFHRRKPKRGKADHRGNGSRDRRVRDANRWSPLRRLIFWPLAILTVATLVLRATSLDLAVSRFFYSPCLGSWPLSPEQPWKALYYYGQYPAMVIGVVGILAAVVGAWSKRRAWVRSGLFLALVLALGPGLLVNGIMKTCVTRPRPIDTLPLGGDHPFLAVLQPAAEYDSSMNSFPSGHAAMAFYLIAPGFLLYRRRADLARCVFYGGAAYGVVMSVARIVQGRHFLSDVVWSAAVVYFTSIGVFFLLRLNESQGANGHAAGTEESADVFEATAGSTGTEEEAKGKKGGYHRAA